MTTGRFASNQALSVADKNRDYVTPYSNYVYYKMFETTGVTLVDSAGNGGNMTVLGTTVVDGTIHANPLWLTPDTGTPDTHTIIGTDAYIHNLMRLDNFTDQQLITSFDYYFDGNVSTSEAFFWWGENDSTSGWGFEMQSAEQMVIKVRGEGATTQGTKTLPSSQITAYGSQRNTITLDLRSASSTTFDAYVYINGAALSSSTGLLLADGDNATGPPVDNDSRGLTIGARNQAGASGYDRNSNNGGGGGVRLANFLMVRRADVNTTLAIDINTQMYNNKGDLPLALDGY